MMHCAFLCPLDFCPRNNIGMIYLISCNLKLFHCERLLYPKMYYKITVCYFCCYGHRALVGHSAASSSAGLTLRAVVEALYGGGRSPPTAWAGNGQQLRHDKWKFLNGILVTQKISVSCLPPNCIFFMKMESFFPSSSKLVSFIFFAFTRWNKFCLNWHL